MDPSAEMSGGSAVIVLRGAMTIPEAAAFREMLQMQLPSSGSAEIDLGGLTEIDITGLQLLCAAHRAMKSRGGELRLGSPLPGAVREAIRLSGLGRSRSCGAGLQDTCLWAKGAENG